MTIWCVFLLVLTLSLPLLLKYMICYSWACVYTTDRIALKFCSFFFCTLLNLHVKESITPLGEVLSRLPVDISIGKMLVLGAIFQIIDPVLSIAAALSVQSPFVRIDSQEEALAAKRRFEVRTQLLMCSTHHRGDKIFGIAECMHRVGLFLVAVMHVNVHYVLDYFRPFE